MRDETFLIDGRKWQIWRWEEQFWHHELDPLRPGGDPVYRAILDTTFALYDKTLFDPARHWEAVRVAGRFTCRHLPWYRDKELPEEEEKFYRDTEQFSYYLGFGDRRLKEAGPLNCPCASSRRRLMPGHVLDHG